MSFHPTIKSGSDSTSIGQNKQSTLIPFPDDFIVRPAHLLPKTSPLETIMMRANDEINMGVVMDTMYESFFGHSMTANKLRALYHVSGDESLMEAIEAQSPLIGSVLRELEIRLSIYVEAMLRADKRIELRDLYWAAGSVALQSLQHMQQFVAQMQVVIPGIEYDEMSNEFITPEDETGDEDVPF